MVIKRFTGMLGSKRNGETSSSSNGGPGFMDRFRVDIRGGSTADDAAPEGDTPEANIGRGVRLFCESGGPNSAQGEEVLHLPVIVEAAESSPAAAAVAAKQIRHFLQKDNYARPHVQYNAVMLIRILADNPGPTFTRNIDSKFVSVTKELLRNGRDPSVQQILRETMQALYTEKAYDTNLQSLFQMWSKEQGLSTRSPPNGAWQNFQASQQQAYGPGRHRGHGGGGLPPPAELAARIEEARTSAKLLQQLVQSTAPHELQTNDLVKEFAERCQAAQRSMQLYINCDNPPPDDDTMQTLIETSEQLSLAASKHSRALLQARRATAQRPLPPEGTTNGTAPPVASATFVPAGQPPAPAPAAAPPSNAPYIPPPIPPPTMRATLERRTSQEYSAPTTPPRPQRTTAPSPPQPSNKPLPNIAPSEPIELPTPNYDNPFSDKHEHGADDDDHDDLYNTSPTVPTRAPPVPTGYGGAATSTATTDTYSPIPRQSPTRPAPQPQDSWRRPVRGPEGSYAPGYRSTPSYVRRQESSGENITMHGAGIVEEEEHPVSPELERRERVGRGVGTVVGGSEVSAASAGSASGRSDGRSAQSGSQGDVSPVDTRGSSGYRYGRQ